MSNQQTNNRDRFKIPQGLVNSGRTSYKNDTKNDTKNDKINLELNKEYIGLVIGKSGATINQIRSDTGADIQLKKINGSDNQMAIISGSESQIRDAEQYIMKVIKRVQNNSNSVESEDKGIVSSRWNQPMRDNDNRVNYPRDQPRDRQYSRDQPRYRQYSRDQPRDRQYSRDQPRDRQ